MGRTVCAQCTFSGTVVDKEKETLPGVQVMLSVNDSLVAATITDDKGKFIIRQLPKGTFLMQLFYPGYTSVEEERTIQTNMDVQLVLMREMNVELESVEVTANRNDLVQRTATGHIYRLSEQAKNSGDPYRALKEIPGVISNEALQSVKMEDGSALLVLVNGNRVNTGIAPIDPKEIESVEVMDVVNARYLQMGVRHIINIKLVEKQHPYTFFQAATRNDVPLRKGFGVVYFEVGNPKFSLYGRASGGYLYNDDSTTEGWQRDTDYYKQSAGKHRSNGNDQLGELIFKWRITEKDYLAAQVYGKHTLKKTETWGNGRYETDTERPFDYTSDNRDDSYILTGSLYHKHSFTKEKVLETTLAFNKNGNDNEGERSEAYPDWLYRNLYRFDNDRTSGSLNIDYTWEWNEVNSLNIGSITDIINDRIRQVSEGYPDFRHRRWNEYLYATFGSKAGNLYYMLSAGVEGIWLRAGSETNRYVKPRAALSGTYEFNDNNSVRLSYTLTNQAPAVGQLNPYNTSTDSLVVTRGNPDLLPMQNHQFEASYTFNKKGFYFTPSISYQLYTDIIEPYGYSDQGIHVSTFLNRGRSEELSVGASVSYRLKKWGRIYAGAYHHVDYFEGQDPRKSFSCDAGFTATYKKWTFVGDMAYRNYAFTAVSRTTQITPEYVQAQVVYNFTKNFYISVAVPYFLGTLSTDTDMYSDTYRSHLNSRLTSASGRPWVLLRYTFRKNDKRKIKLDNVLRSKEQGISL